MNKWQSWESWGKLRKKLAKFGVMRYNDNVEFGCFV